MVANFPAAKWPWRPTFEHVHVRSVVKKGPLAQDLDTLMSVTTGPAELVTSHIVVFMFSQPPAAGIKGEHQTVARKLLTPQTIRLGHGDTQGVWSVEDMTSQLANRKPTFVTLTLCPLSVFTSVSLHPRRGWCLVPCQ